MKKYIFGYGSLINLESASRTLKRPLSKGDVKVANLKNYQRNWLLWDTVFSSELSEEVRGIFLNVSYSEGEYLNGVLIELNDEELGYFKIREKNYNCVDVSENIELELNDSDEEYIVYTFAGKSDFLLNNDFTNSYIFEKYIDIVNIGLSNFGEAFYSEFTKTTVLNSVPKLSGTYTFVDSSQQKAR